MTTKVAENDPRWKTAASPELAAMEMLERDFVQATRELAMLKTHLTNFTHKHPKVPLANALHAVDHAVDNAEAAFKAFTETYKDEQDVARHEEEEFGRHDVPEHR